MFRRVFRAAAVLGVVVILAVGSLPVWFPWVLTGAGARLGFTFDAYDRVGFNRLELSGVQFMMPGVEIEADTILLPVWPWWLLKSDLYSGASDNPEVVVGGWTLAIGPTDGPKRGTDGSILRLYDQIAEVMPAVRRYVPAILLKDGVVEAGGSHYNLAEVSWSAMALDARVSDTGGLWTGTVRLRMPVDRPWVADIVISPWDASVSAVLARSPQGLDLSLGLQWKANALSGSVRFGPDGFLPESGGMRSETLSIDIGPVGIEGYAPATGTFDLAWSGERYALDLDLKTDPVAGPDFEGPPLRVSVEAEGDVNRIRIGLLEVRAPWALARLSESIEIPFGKSVFEQSARFDFEINLTASPFPAAGRIAGTADLATVSGDWPSLDLRLEAEDVTLDGVEALDALSVEADMHFTYPYLALNRMNIRSGSRSASSLSAEIDVDKRVVEGVFDAVIDSELIGRFLPAGVALDLLSLEGVFKGPLSAPDYTLLGRIDHFEAPGLLPSSVSVDVRGCGFEINHWRVHLETEEAAVEFTGSGVFAGGASRGILDGFLIYRDGLISMESDSGSRLEFDAQGVGGGRFRISNENRQLEADLDIAWPQRARWSIHGENLSTSLLDGLIDSGAVWVGFDTFRSEGEWSAGPALFFLKTGGRLILSGEEVAFRADLAGRETALIVNECVVSSADADILEISGRVPLVFTPGAVEAYRVDWEKSLGLSVRSTPDPAFWGRVADVTGFDVKDPELGIVLEGPMSAPAGTILFRAGSVGFPSPSANGSPMVITDLNLNAQITENRLVVNESTLRVEGEGLSIRGEVPLGRDRWRRLVMDGEIPDLWAATVNLRSDGARIAAFARYLPTVLGPTGTLDMDVTLLPGRRVEGYLVLKDAAMRPIRPFGTMHSIGARVVFRDRTIQCEEISAVIGGQEVKVAGEFTWDEDFTLEYDFSIVGVEVPFVREPGLVLRSDLDLRLVRSTHGGVLLSGSFGLVDSLFVADLSSLFSGGADAPSRRPPYFSIEAKPFADWHLDLEMDGSRFMRVETPVFRGVLSADFALTGTLLEPKVLGDVQIESGSVEFPFASMKMESGNLSIREDNPYDIALDLMARARVFGFDVTLLVDGWSSSPRLTFESEPNLGSEAVLMMLTTGEIPNRRGYYSMQQRMTKLAVYLGRTLLMEFGIGGGEERFVIESGSDISLKGRETYKVELILTDRWSLVGGYDEFDSYNGGVKWRVFSR